MTRRRVVLSALALALLLGASLNASMVLKMNLGDMVDRAGSIYRGTVLSVSEGTIEAGGGELPTVTYRILVSEGFKGEFRSKGDQSYTEITMIAAPRGKTIDGVRQFSMLPEMPQMRVGGDYLLLTTPPSSIGLSTTVGLGQGKFGISKVEKEDFATNDLGNLGLYDGPVAYVDLANDIRTILGQ